MVVRRSRRSLVAAILGGTAVAAVGGFAWSGYASRNHLDLRVRGVNRSAEPADVAVRVLEDGDVYFEQSARLGAAGDERPPDVQHLPGPWIKQPGPYSLEVSAVGESRTLANEEIIDRLGETGWGSERVDVAIVVTEDRLLETTVESPDRR